ncbi:MAG: 6,7-dimethyl-8-ribityllumazine synthase [Bacteroidales bacterium]|nr:6,7-dimethyl-8-ribityllumazine synthase [Bacteroidales bacterium]
METKKTNLSDYNHDTVPSGKGMKIGIVVADWNRQITDALCQGAYNTLTDNQVNENDITVVHVPGSFELPTGAATLLNSSTNFDAVICLGCVIQGETRHFDFICSAVAHGLTNLSLQDGRPVIFGVLTTNDMQQAIDRSGGKHGNKGVEAAVTAIKMVAMQSQHLI